MNDNAILSIFLHCEHLLSQYKCTVLLCWSVIIVEIHDFIYILYRLKMVIEQKLW